MYTAKIKTKEFINGALSVSVEFTDGTTSVIESCIPQDRAGFDHWVKSRLATFNGGVQIDADFAVNDAVEFTEPVVATPTAAELAEREWFGNYQKLQEIQKLIDLSVLVGGETKVVNLRNKVKTDFKPEYLNLI